MKKTIYILRHAEARGQEKAAPLTKVGEQQAEELVTFFENKRINCIYSSPFKRAIQTIEPLAKVLKQKIILDPRLGERILSSKDLPDWRSKLAATFLDEELSFPGGETSKEATIRIREVIDEIKGDTILVTHGNIMALLLRSYDPSFGFKEWERLTNPDIYQLRIKSNDFSLDRIYNKKN